jgi:hypothetical protein
MAGFSSYDDLITQITTNGQANDAISYKTGSTMQGAGFWHRTWIAAGYPAAGSEPAGTPGAAHSADTHAVTFGNVSTKQRYGVSFGAVATQSCTLMLHDRLVGVGGLSSASTGSKTVSSAALTRYTSGAQVQAWLEVTTASTTTQAVTHLLSYTGDVNGAGQVGANFTWPAAATVKDCAVGPMPLVAGDTGVKACSTINVDTANTAGVFNFVQLRPLVYLPLIANQWNERDLVLQLAALPQIFDTACLGHYCLASAVTATNFQWQIRTAYE